MPQSSELETGMSHDRFFSELPAWSSELETGMSLFFRVARVEFRVKFRVEAAVGGRIPHCGQLYQAIFLYQATSLSQP